MLPRKASDTITELCLDHGAALWVLRTNQVGGENPDIEPVAPIHAVTVRLSGCISAT
jgi:predicted Abi (CAAX) family protease